MWKAANKSRILKTRNCYYVAGWIGAGSVCMTCFADFMREDSYPAIQELTMYPISIPMLLEPTIIIDRVAKKYAHNVTTIKAEPKINRNSPCKCGSGKKVKKCCK